MSELWLPAGIAVASLAMTYLCCIRPMRRRQCGPAAANPESELDRALRQARADLHRVLEESRQDAMTQTQQRHSFEDRAAAAEG